MKNLFFPAVFGSVFLLTLLSCSKEDKEFPVIDAKFSAQKEMYFVGDTLLMFGTYTDNKGIASVRVDLVNDESMVYASADAYRTGKPQKKLYLPHIIILNDSTIQSGVYRLRITVNDGTNESVRYLGVNVTGIPKRLNGWMIYDEDNGLIRIRTVDSLYQMNDFFTTSGNLIAFGYQSVKKQVYIADNTALTMTAYKYPDMSSQWTYSPLYPFFSFAQTDSIAFTGTYDGMIRGFDFSGAVKFTGNTLMSGVFPVKILCVNNFVYSIQTNPSGGVYLVAYNLQTGQIVQSTTLSFLPVDICKCDNNSIFLLKQNAATATIYQYSITNNSVFLLKQINESCMSMCYLEDKHIVVGGTSYVYDYRYTINSATQAFYMPEVRKMYFDPLTGALAGINNQKVFFTSKTFQNVRVILLNSSNKCGILPMYNK